MHFAARIGEEFVFDFQSHSFWKENIQTREVVPWDDGQSYEVSWRGDYPPMVNYSGGRVTHIDLIPNPIPDLELARRFVWSARQTQRAIDGLPHTSGQLPYQEGISVKDWVHPNWTDELEAEAEAHVVRCNERAQQEENAIRSWVRQRVNA